jgi:formamidopyrimidine-DNA glycosylase
MPELPEVETTVRGINSKVIKKRIIGVWTDYSSPLKQFLNTIKNPAFFKKFEKAIVGAKIIKCTRRAKNILIHLDNKKVILVHMKMTGHMMYGTYQKTHAKKDSWKPSSLLPKTSPLFDPFNRFIHLVFCFDDGTHLVLSDMRKFAKITLFNSEEIDTIEDLKKIGPEPLDTKFTLTLFKERLLLKPQTTIKQTLLDQSVLAGVGNIYTDESLWLSGIHPLSVTKSIPNKLITKLYHSLIFTLSKGINFGGDSMSDYRNIDGERGAFQGQHNAYRKTGTSCKKKGCGGVIKRISLAGRGTHFCPQHQTIFATDVVVD